MFFVLLLFLNLLFVESISFYTILSYLVIFVLFVFLAYISYMDFKTMEISNRVSLFLMLFLFLLNLSLFFYTPSSTGLFITNRFSYIPYDNFISAILLGLGFLLLVFFTKEKALGAGDIRVAIVVGLLIGQGNLIGWLYITIFSALIYGITIAYKKKRIKNLKIPFAPFMILGGIVCLIVSLYI